MAKQMAKGPQTDLWKIIETGKWIRKKQWNISKKIFAIGL